MYQRTHSSMISASKRRRRYMGSRTIGLVIWASRRRPNCTAMPLNATEPAKTARLVTIRKIRDFLVAREGIEPPTRGFSVLRQIEPKILITLRKCLGECLIFSLDRLT